MSRLDDLYASYFKPLIGVLMRSGMQEQDAADVAQETMIKTWKRLESISKHGEWAYLLTAAVRLAHNGRRNAGAVRRGGGRVTGLEDAGDPRDEKRSVENELIVDQEIAEFRRRFNAAMGELSPDTRQMVLLRKQGYSSKEIATEFELSDTAVRTRLSRAFDVIRARVGEPPAGVDWMNLLGEDDDHKH